MRAFNHSSKAFTLLEAVIASVVVFIIGISIIITITQSFYQKQFERERAVALNRATIKIEELKRALYPAVSATEGAGEDIMLDVHNTPANPSDDIPAKLIVELFHLDTGIAIEDTREDDTINRDANDMVEVRVSVRWTTRGKERVQTVNTRLAP